MDGDDAGWDRPHHRGERRLALERRAEAALLQELDDPRGDAPADVDAPRGQERQREVAADPAEHAPEQLQRLGGMRVRGIEARLGHRGRLDLLRRLAGPDMAHGGVQAREARAREHRLDGDPVLDPFQGVPDLLLEGVGGAEIGVARLGGDEPVHHVGAGHDRPQGQAVGEPLGQAQDVGGRRPMLGGEHLAGAADPGLDLVQDEQDAVPVAERRAGPAGTRAAGRCSRPRPGSARRRSPPARRAGRRSCSRRLDALQVAVPGVLDLGHQRREPAAVDRLRGRQRHRAEGPAVEGAEERHRRGAARCGGGRA